MTFEMIAWLFVLSVFAHNFEEAIWLPAWSRSAGRWHVAVTNREFRFAVAVLTALAAIAASLVTLQGKGSVGAYLVSGYALAMLLNVFFPHLLATLALRRYTPGATTAVLVILPVTTILIWRALSENYIELHRFLVIGPAVVIGILISIPMLFWLGRKFSPMTA
ncbi:MAG: HXXEE domain-containing protein [Xanthobacteraceae bacterium]